VVADVGRRVQRFAIGDRVTAPFVHGCGRCSWCRTGQAQVCPDQTQPGFTHPGSFAEQVVVRVADLNLVRLPDDLEFVPAAALGCRFATAYRALTAHGRVQPGHWVAVFGCGGVGLSAVLIAVALGARVVGVDTSAAAAQRAAELGAEITVTATDPVPVVLEATDGGAHVGVDAYGSSATAAGSIRTLRRRGRHLQVGLMSGPDAGAGVPWEQVVARELELYGCHGMAAADYRPMLAQVASGRLRPDLLVGRVIRLSDAPAALMAFDRPPAAPGTTMIDLRA
jgi:alcohol dehydrogenase